MIEVRKGLYVGDEGSWMESNGHPCGVSVLYCAKEPWHRRAVGYEGRGAPREHPDYYYAYRGNTLNLNLVDADRVEYIPEVVIDEGIKFIGERLGIGDKVLVCCNQGESRAPGIAMLWMWERGELPREWENVGKAFLEIYPKFRPGRGMCEFIKRRIKG